MDMNCGGLFFGQDDFEMNLLRAFFLYCMLAFLVVLRFPLSPYHIHVLTVPSSKKSSSRSGSNRCVTGVGGDGLEVRDCIVHDCWKCMW